MQKTTEELLNILKKSSQPSEYIETHRDILTDRPLHEYLERCAAEEGLEKSEVIRRSGLDRTYTYQIFTGRKKPSRDKLLALCMAMNRSLDEIQSLLKSSSYPVLYPKIERDSIIIFAIQKNATVLETNELLYELGQPVLE